MGSECCSSEESEGGNMKLTTQFLLVVLVSLAYADEEIGENEVHGGPNPHYGGLYAGYYNYGYPSYYTYGYPYYGVYGRKKRETESVGDDISEPETESGPNPHYYGYYGRYYGYPYYGRSWWPYGWGYHGRKKRAVDDEEPASGPNPDPHYYYSNYYGGHYPYYRSYGYYGYRYPYYGYYHGK